MKTISKIATLLGACMVCAGAWAQAGLPAVRHSGSIDYISGGIGSDESSAIKAASAQWPVTLEFSVNAKPRADYASNVTVTVRNAQGAVAFEAASTGPFLLIKLPPGQYSVDALYGGQTLKQKLTLKQGAPSHASFVWPAQTG